MEEYFAKLRAAHDKITIPTDYRRPEAAQTVDPTSVEARFIEANRSLQSEAISVSCDDGYLSEIRLCMTKDLAFRPCPALERRSCKAASLNMPPVGGG
jgi:ribonuclease T2